MKRILTILGAVALSVMTMLSQELDRTYIFVDADGNEIVNGSTIVCSNVETDAMGQEVINSGVYVKSDNSDVYIQIYYTINQIDNGTFQICYPAACITQTELGIYVTPVGKTSDIFSLNTEWFPTADGVCDVTYMIETLTKKSGFPVKYSHKGYGSTITIHYVKGGSVGVPGDVNGDGEVNISDVNAVIDAILSSNTDARYDVNGDGEVNIGDVNAVIGIILTLNSATL